jgi:hypothetical protein
MMPDPKTAAEWLEFAVKHGTKDDLLEACRQQFSFLLAQGDIAHQMLRAAWQKLSAQDEKARAEFMAWLKANPEPEGIGDKYRRWLNGYKSRREALDSMEKKTEAAWERCEAYWAWSRREREVRPNV